MIIKIIPPDILEYSPILLPIIFPNKRPRYVNIPLIIQNVDEANK